MKNSILLLLALFILSATVAQPQIKTIDSIINSKLSEDDPGLFVGVVKEGTIIYEGYRGLANLQHKIKVNENTRSNIASTAKQFTALMILQLALDEKLNLEDDIRKYLPKLYPNLKEKIKIMHVLNHTSGIRDFYDLMSIQRDPWWRKEGFDNDDAIALLEKQEDLAFTPGSKYMYSNSGYILLAKIIEQVSGEKFHEYSGKFFKSLGMNNTAFLKNYMHVIPNQALPYSDWGDGVWQQYPMITNLYGDGFLFTTLKDQLIFEQAIQHAKRNKDTLLIESQKPIPNSEITSYGYGVALEDRLHHKSVHHSGGTGSYHAQTIRFPNEKLTVFVMSNNSKLWSGAIADEIARLFLPKKEVKITYDNSIHTITNTLSKQQIMGQYLSPNNDLIRVEENEEGKLTWKNGNNNPIILDKELKNKYSVSYNSALKIGFFSEEMLLFYPTGKVIAYSKIPKQEIKLQDLESYEGQYYSRELEVTFSLKLMNNRLMISLDGAEEKHEVELLTKDEFLVFDYIMSVERDRFNRVIGILLTTNRVLNNRFIKKTNVQFQPKIETADGSINVSTIEAKDGKSSQILLTKNDANGHEIWSQQFGGKSYDKANSIIATNNGYLIVGATSSYGNGNYDMFVIRTDKKGNTLWQNTYGMFGNDYGYTAEITNNGYIIKGITQKCTSNTDVLHRNCITNVWLITIDKNGKEISNQVLEAIE